jgi:thymidine kinase
VAKLYFRYGTMDSAKSMNLLAVAHNYRKQGKRVLLAKPRLDSRFGSTKISSRSGLEAERVRRPRLRADRRGAVPAAGGDR